MSPRAKGFGASEVRRAAELAHLELGPEEATRFAADIEPVLEGFEAIRPTDAPPGPSRRGRVEGLELRPDVPDADQLAASPSELAPSWQEGFFLVPRLPALDK